MQPGSDDFVIALSVNRSCNTWGNTLALSRWGFREQFLWNFVAMCCGEPSLPEIVEFRGGLHLDDGMSRLWPRSVASHGVVFHGSDRTAGVLKHSRPLRFLNPRVPRRSADCQRRIVSRRHCEQQSRQQSASSNVSLNLSPSYVHSILVP